MTLIQIDGMSGTGKTTVAEYLSKHGYETVDADATFGYFGDPKTGKPVDEEHEKNWIWDKEKILSFSRASADKTIYVCGGAANQEEIKYIFDKRIMLVIDDETMKHRLLSRTNNDFGKHPDVLARQLERNKSAVDYAKSIGATIIDATRPIEQVVNSILKVTGQETA